MSLIEAAGEGAPDDNESSGSSSSKGGSGSSSGSTYPKFQERVPKHSIEEHDGDWEYRTYPECTPITFRKESSSDSWSRDHVPEEVKSMWWDHPDFIRAKKRVHRELELDLMQLLNEDPQKGRQAITRAANLSGGAEQVSHTRKCGVCSTELHLVKDDYEEIDNSIVCEEHNVADLKSAGII